jgi:hypothetical protein
MRTRSRKDHGAS